MTMMRTQYRAIGLAMATLVSLASGAVAQSLSSQPDRNGNYYSNDAPVKATPSSGRLMAGSLWEVTAHELNCRRAPRSNAPVVHQFQQGDVLQANVYRGGSDEVLLNRKDADGNPWMPVRRDGSAHECYVRANRQFIQPVIGH
jgi:hypothetical protein